MNLLDENIPRRQRLILAGWRIRFREIGEEVGYSGIKDAEIIPLLHSLRPVTFFTLDNDFYKRHLCHPSYCLVYLDIEENEVAAIVRRFLRHPSFDTLAKRTGTVRTVWLNLTWVRVYDAGAQLGFHVFPGFAPFYGPDMPQIAFDRDPQAITGRLGYYQVLLGKGSRASLFNYQKWIRRYLNNR